MTRHRLQWALYQPAATVQCLHRLGAAAWGPFGRPARAAERERLRHSAWDAAPSTSACAARSPQSPPAPAYKRLRQLVRATPCGLCRAQGAQGAFEPAGRSFWQLCAPNTATPRACSHQLDIAPAAAPPPRGQASSLLAARSRRRRGVMARRLLLVALIAAMASGKRRARRALALPPACPPLARPLDAGRAGDPGCSCGRAAARDGRHPARKHGSTARLDGAVCLP
jgi:hypothetical protein